MTRRSLAGLTVVLLAAAAVVTIVRSSTPAADDDAPGLLAGPLPDPRDVTRDAPARARRAPPKDSEFTIAFAGDVHFEAHLRELLERPEAALSDVAPLLQRPNFAMLNLETAITERGAPEAKDYTFRAPATALQALAAAGVDLVSLANNHGMDFGPEGFEDTLSAKADSPVAMIGIGRNAAEAYAPHVVTLEGTRVAFLAATVAPEPTTDAWAAVGPKGGLATAVDPRQLLSAVQQAGTHTDLVVVYMHWGDERESCPTNDQKRLQRQLTAAGADVVVGSHAHVLLGSGWTDDGAYVNYGLGNFVWYHGRDEAVARTGVLTLTVRGGRVVAHDWAPARIPESGGAPRPLSGNEAEDARARWHELRDCAGLMDRPPDGN